jgi:predicted metal-dependent peptidase
MENLRRKQSSADKRTNGRLLRSRRCGLRRRAVMTPHKSNAHSLRHARRHRTGARSSGTSLPLPIRPMTSGSSGTAELEQFAGEITAINEEAQPERIHVLYCDALCRGRGVWSGRANQGISKRWRWNGFCTGFLLGGGERHFPEMSYLSDRPVLRFIPGSR